MENDRLTFWRNWFAGVDSFPDDMRLAWYDATMRFAFLGVEPEHPNPDEPLSAIRWNAVQMIRASVAHSRKQRLNGSQHKAKRKPTQSQRKAKRKQEQVQEQVQEQEQYANIATTAQARGKTMPTVSVFVDSGKLAGVPDEAWLRDLHRELVEAGWADKDGRRIGNWRRYLKTAWVDFQKKLSARAWAVDALDSIRDAR